MASPALQHLGDTGNNLTLLSIVSVGGDDLSTSLRRDRAGVSHERYGVVIAARTWMNAKVWNYSVSIASQSYIESLQAFYEAGTFYLYPDSDNVDLKYTVHWQENSFAPVYIAPNKYSLQCTFKETTIGTDTPAFLTTDGSQTVGGSLIVNGGLYVNGSETISQSLAIASGLTVGGSIAVTSGLTVAGNISATGATSTITANTITANNLRSNGDIFVNYNGGEGASRIWFYENGGPSGASIWWDETSSAVAITKPLAVDGGSTYWGRGGSSFVVDVCNADAYFIYDKNAHSMTMTQASTFLTGGLKAVGEITGTSGIRLSGNISMKELGAANADAWIYFDSGNTKFFGWNNGASAFEFSGNIRANQYIYCSSYIQATGSLYGANLYLDQGGANGTHFIQWSGTSTSATAPRIAYTSSTDMFEFNRKTNFSGTVSASNFYSIGSVSANTFSGITSTKSFTILSPTAAENMALWYTNRSITLTKIQTVLRGTGTPSVTWEMGYDTVRDAAPPDPIIGGQVSTGTSTGTQYTSFTTATIPANNWILFYSTATGGTLVNDFHMTIEFKET